MSTLQIVAIVFSAVLLLLFLVLKARINSFVALLMIAIYVGICSGMPFDGIINSIREGMGGTLGFVAVVVGLGAIFGQFLEYSGGAEALAHRLVQKFGKERASWAMVLVGFIIAIPVFFDVGFIIMVPIIYALSRDTKRSLLFYAIPLLAGLAVTHSFIPPTPGPVAVADILDVQLGWVILFGFLTGIPTAIIAGPVFGKYIALRIHLTPPSELFSDQGTARTGQSPGFRLVLVIIAIPLVLIVAGTLTSLFVEQKIIEPGLLPSLIEFLGDPFSALIIATLTAWYFLGVRMGKTRDELLKLSGKALGPAGIIILITGAGGVLKQILIDSGMGQMLADSIAGSALSPILLAWILAAVVRVTQGSSTVAMITAAGIIAPVLEVMHIDPMQRALIVLSVASGATILSHVNDSGFWLVGKYLGIDEKDTLRTWTVMETIISVCGLVFCMITSLLLKWLA